MVPIRGINLQSDLFNATIATYSMFVVSLRCLPQKQKEYSFLVSSIVNVLILKSDSQSIIPHIF
jgi:hypothetical protein